MGVGFGQSLIMRIKAANAVRPLWLMLRLLV